jgi:hypothetical protein
MAAMADPTPDETHRAVSTVAQRKRLSKLKIFSNSGVKKDL